eukprot:Nk52_evm55s32 gene=Nk52_evmTU55s32
MSSWLKSFRRASDSVSKGQSGSDWSLGLKGAKCPCCTSNLVHFSKDPGWDEKLGSKWEKCRQEIEVFGYKSAEVIELLKEFLEDFIVSNNSEGQHGSNHEDFAQKSGELKGHRCDVVVEIVLITEKFLAQYLWEYSKENFEFEKGIENEINELIAVILRTYSEVLFKFDNDVQIIKNHGGHHVFLDHCAELFDLFNPVSSARLEENRKIQWGFDCIPEPLLKHTLNILAIIYTIFDRKESWKKALTSSDFTGALDFISSDVSVEKGVVGTLIGCLQTLQIICAKSEALSAELYMIQEALINTLAPVILRSPSAPAEFLSRSGLEVLFSVLGWKSCFVRSPQTNRQSYSTIYSKTKSSILKCEFRSQLLAFRTILGLTGSSNAIRKKFVALNGGSLLIDFFLWVSVHGNRFGGTFDNYRDLIECGNFSFMGSRFMPQAEKTTVKDFLPPNMDSFLQPKMNEVAHKCLRPVSLDSPNKLTCVELDVLFSTLFFHMFYSNVCEKSNSIADLGEGLTFSSMGKLLFEMSFLIFDDSIRDTHDNNNARLHLRWNICEIHFFVIEFWKICMQLDSGVYAIGKASNVLHTLFSTYFFGTGSSNSSGDGAAPELKRKILDFVVYLSTLSDHKNQEEIQKLISFLYMYTDFSMVVDIMERLFVIMISNTSQTQQSFYNLDGLSSLFSIVEVCVARRTSLPSSTSKAETPMNKVLSYSFCIIKAYISLFDEGLVQIYENREHLQVIFRLLLCRSISVDCDLWQFSRWLVLYAAARDFESGLEDSESNSFYIFHTYLDMFSDTSKSEEDMVIFEVRMLEGINKMLSECDDAVKVKVALVDLGIFLKSVNLLVTRHTDIVDVQLNLCAAVLNLIAVLIIDSPYGERKFKEQLGFSHLKKFIVTGLNDVFPEELIYPLMNVAVGGEFNLAQCYNIRNVGPLVMGLDLLDNMSYSTQEKYLSLLRAVLEMSYINRTRCCEFGLVDVLIKRISHFYEENNPNAICNLLLNILSSLGSHSIAASELKSMFRLINNPTISQSSERMNSLIGCMKTFSERIGPDNFFEFTGHNTGISVQKLQKWPSSKGYTFNCWFRFECNLSAATEDSKQAIYSFRFESGAGACIYLNSDYQVCASIYNPGYKDAFVDAVLCEEKLSPKTWRFVSVTHNYTIKPWARTEVSLYINGIFAGKLEARYPTSSGKLEYFNIGSSRELENQSYEAVDYSHIHFMSFQGQMGNIHLFGDCLSSGIIKSLFELGPNYVGLFESIDAPNYSKKLRGLFDGTLNAKLHLTYNAKACQNNECIDLSPESFHMSYTVAKRSSYDGFLSYRGMGNHYGILDGFQCVTKPFNSSLNSLGGMPLLLVIVAPSRNRGTFSYSNLHFTLSQDLIDTLFDFVLCMIVDNPINRDVMVKTKGFSVFANMFLHHPHFMSANFFSSCQKLVRSVGQESNELFLEHFYKYLLFNFNIWIKVPFVLQSQVLQYVHSLVEENVLYFNESFGLSFFCDMLCTLLPYSNSENCSLNTHAGSQRSSPVGRKLTAHELSVIRMMVFNIVRLFIKVDKDGKELKALFGYTLLCSDDESRAEFLELIVDSHLSLTSTIILDRFIEYGCFDLLFLCLTSSLERLRVAALRIIAISVSSSSVSERSKKALLSNDKLKGLSFVSSTENVSQSQIACLIDISTARKYDSSFSGKGRSMNSLMRENEPYLNLQFCDVLLSIMKMCLKVPRDLVQFALREVFCVLSLKSENVDVLEKSVSYHHDLLNCLTIFKEDEVVLYDNEILVGIIDVALTIVQKRFFLEKSSVKRLWHIFDVAGCLFRRKKISKELFDVFCVEVVLGMAVFLINVVKQGPADNQRMPFLVNHVAQILILCEKTIFFDVTHLENYSELEKGIPDVVGMMRIEVKRREHRLEVGDRRTLLASKMMHLLALLPVQKLASCQFYKILLMGKDRPLREPVLLCIFDICKPLLNCSTENCVFAARYLFGLFEHLKVKDIALVSYIVYSFFEELVLAREKATGNEKIIVPLLKQILKIFKPHLEKKMKIKWEVIDGNYSGDEFVQWIDSSGFDFKNEDILRKYKEHYEMLAKTKELPKVHDALNKGTESALKSLKAELNSETLVEQSMKAIQKCETTRKYALDVKHTLSRKKSIFDNDERLNIRDWSSFVSFYTSERGPFYMGGDVKAYWKLDRTEDIHRMRKKLTRNYDFNSHTDASILRDEGVSRTRPNHAHRLSAKAKNDEVLNLGKSAVIARVMDGAEDEVNEEEWDYMLGFEDVVVEKPIDYNLRDSEKEEEVVHCVDCSVVTLMTVVKGRLEITNKNLYFYADRELSYEMDSVGFDINVIKNYKWPLDQIREIHLRRYLLRRSALEIFLVDQTNYFLNFNKQDRNKVYSKIIYQRPRNLIYSDSRSPAELLRKSGLTQKWQAGEISNFDYLMQLNTIAGRTYNDLNQYPVFPWILADYESDTIDLEDPKCYRDLSKPVGALNEKRLSIFIDRYNSFEDPCGQIDKFHYGTHYSTAASVLFYLLRVEPYTTLHINLQGGKFDHTDRQFNSIPSTWNSVLNSTSDVKELIPEFFFFPEFLENSNGFDLGTLQSGVKVNDVTLPKWAKTPEEFIRIHRQALESDYVSAHLHEWIDLVFGYKQKGPAAVEAYNVFYYITYEGAIDLDAINDDNERKAIEAQISNFGQTPCQLMKKPHPMRKISFFDSVLNLAYAASTSAAAVKNSFRPKTVIKSCFKSLQSLKAYSIQVYENHDPVCFIGIPESQLFSFIYNGTPDRVITVSRAGVIGEHGWLATSASSTSDASKPPFQFDRDPSLASTKRLVGNLLESYVNISTNVICLSKDGKFIISAGHWDNSFKVIAVDSGKVTQNVHKHDDVVTCLDVGSQGRYIATGSKDTTCMIWEVVYQGSNIFGVDDKPLHRLNGHDMPISCVAVHSEQDLVVTGSLDGTCIVSTILQGNYVRTITPPLPSGANPEHFEQAVEHVLVSSSGTIIMYMSCRSNFSTAMYVIHTFTINGKLLASASLTQPINAIAVSGDSEHLVMGSEDGIMTIRRTYDLKSIFSSTLNSPIDSVALLLTESYIMLGTREGKIIVMAPNITAKPEKDSLL